MIERKLNKLSFGIFRPGRLMDSIFKDELKLLVSCGETFSNTELKRIARRYTKLVMKLIANGKNTHYAKRFAVLTAFGCGCHDFRRIMSEVYALHCKHNHYDDVAESMAYYCALAYVNDLPELLLEGCDNYDKPWQQEYIRKLYAPQSFHPSCS
ncbi:MAG: hypothetical protein K6A41_07705 [Bacteroidales bacterium]|nr:hypothetical protein [Bacteroidales bacterium]